LHTQLELFLHKTEFTDTITGLKYK